MSCTKSYGGWTRCLIIVAVALSLSGLGVGIYFIVKSTPASDNAESTAESSTIVNTESTTESSSSDQDYIDYYYYDDYSDDDDLGGFSDGQDKPKIPRNLIKKFLKNQQIRLDGKFYDVDSDEYSKCFKKSEKFMTLTAAICQESTTNQCIPSVVEFKRIPRIQAREYPNKISAIIKLCGQKNRNTGKIVYYKFLRTLQPEMLPPKCQPNFDAVKEDLIQTYQDGKCGSLRKEGEAGNFNDYMLDSTPNLNSVVVCIDGGNSVCRSFQFKLVNSDCTGASTKEDWDCVGKNAVVCPENLCEPNY